MVYLGDDHLDHAQCHQYSSTITIQHSTHHATFSCMKLQYHCRFSLFNGTIHQTRINPTPTHHRQNPDPTLRDPSMERAQVTKQMQAQYFPALQWSSTQSTRQIWSSLDQLGSFGQKQAWRLLRTGLFLDWIRLAKTWHTQPEPNQIQAFYYFFWWTTSWFPVSHPTSAWPMILSKVECEHQTLHTRQENQQHCCLHWGGSNQGRSTPTSLSPPCTPCCYFC